MPFFHIAVDLVTREWITVEAPDKKIAREWATEHAGEVYEDFYGLGGADHAEYASITEVAAGEESKFTVEARLDENGEEIAEESE